MRLSFLNFTLQISPRQRFTAYVIEINDFGKVTEAWTPGPPWAPPGAAFRRSKLQALGIDLGYMRIMGIYCRFILKHQTFWDNFSLVGPVNILQAANADRTNGHILFQDYQSLAFSVRSFSIPSEIRSATFKTPVFTLHIYAVSMRLESAPQRTSDN